MEPRDTMEPRDSDSWSDLEMIQFYLGDSPELLRETECPDSFGADSRYQPTPRFRGKDVWTNYRHNKPLREEEIIHYPEILHTCFSDPCVVFLSQGHPYRLVLVENKDKQSWFKRLLQKVRLAPREPRVPLNLVCEDVQFVIDDLQFFGVEGLNNLLPGALAFIQHRYPHIDSVMLTMDPHRGVTVIFI